jgi:superfamily II DNA or RNA helicase
MIDLRPHQQTIIDTLLENRKGQIIVPTGGGKTMCMIKDAQKRFNDCNWDLVNKDCDRKTVVVVAPRILLAQQLCEDFVKYVARNPFLRHHILHVHSGDTHHESTTNSDAIIQWTKDNYRFNKLIFTTYHSLHRIQEAEIDVDTIYFDEAHNSVQKNFIEAVEYHSMYANRCYFFTATPKHSRTPFKIGMNDEDIFGKVLVNVPAPDLVNQGYILPPKVTIKKIDETDDSRFRHEKDCDNVIDSIDDCNKDKILVCARSTKQIVSLTSLTDFCIQLRSRGYSWMYITSKTGAIIDGKKVSREDFFTKLNEWGADDDKKFVVLHHSILSEGINVSGLDTAIFLRSMDYITISQTIGRVIRKGNAAKTYGLICVPVYDKVGITTSRKVEAVVDTVFTRGEPAISIVRS